jgi:hypothetical protein
VDQSNSVRRGRIRGTVGSAFTQTAPPTDTPAASPVNPSSCSPEFVKRWGVVASQVEELRRSYFDAMAALHLQGASRELLCSRAQTVMDLEKRFIVDVQSNVAACQRAARVIGQWKVHYFDMQVSCDYICSDEPLRRLHVPCPWPAERATTECKFSGAEGPLRVILNS